MAKVPCCSSCPEKIYGKNYNTGFGALNLSSSDDEDDEDGREAGCGDSAEAQANAEGASKPHPGQPDAEAPGSIFRAASGTEPESQQLKPSKLALPKRAGTGSKQQRRKRKGKSRNAKADKQEREQMQEILTW